MSLATEELLLQAALELSGSLELERLAGELREYLLAVPALAVGALVIRHEDRDVFQVHLLPAGAEAAAPECLEVPCGSPGARLFPSEEPVEPVELRRAAAAATAHDDPEARLHELGARCALSWPLQVGERRLGALVAGFAGDDPPAPESREYLRRLARLLGPLAWNCFAHERFSRGDERRDSLVELSSGINASLELDKVLALARRVIGGLAGHCSSWIDLLNEDGRSFRRYRNPPSPAAGPAGHETHALGASAMAWLLECGRTWQSGDLERRTRFSGDADLRAEGVRHYVATPMFAGGRIIGGFFFGSSDARPPLHVDIWLYENIALQLGLAIDNAQKHEQLRRLSARQAQENVYLREEIQSEHNFGEIVGQSPAMQAVYDQISRVAGTGSSVLITGPTGVGKELVARAIHAGSPRAEQPMVKLNCAAIPEGTVESELFGHERGSFTSAVERHVGRFELAREGTLFLDEVGELPLAVQAKLLRVLQDGEFERIGGRRTLHSNARILAATNRDLQQAMQRGTFRSDLYYRLNVFPIRVPPLAERREDIPLLVEAFIEKLGRRMGKRVEGIDANSMEALCAREWPGNVRELQHVIERAIILGDGPVLHVPAATGFSAVSVTQDSASTVTLPTLEAVEADHIRRALERSKGVIEGPKGAAELLGLKPSTLRFRMKRFGIRRPG